jgi:hypothetical protein
MVKLICSFIDCKVYEVTGGIKGLCSKHGGGKRCLEIGCGISATRGGTQFCKKHGGGKRCLEIGCGIAATRGGTQFCKKHGGGKRCLEIGCELGARSGGAQYCKKHGGGKRCLEIGCGIAADTDGGTQYCKKHGGGYRCPNCIDWIDSRIRCKKYDGYCATCFKMVFPDDKRSAVIYQKGPEIKVRNYLNTEYKGFIHDHPIFTGDCDCSHRRRIDHRKFINNTMLAIETDERQHKGYDQKDEDIRYDDLFMACSGKWIYVRLNTDSYVDDRGVKKNTKLEIRLKVLKAVVDEQIRKIKAGENTDLIIIIKLYYDGFKQPEL